LVVLITMKVYTLLRHQFLPIDLKTAWDFFSSPGNLSSITPKEMNFKILSMSGGEKMYPGQIINYKVNVLPFLRVRWVTEITHVDAPFYFTDEQRFGPYALWHHKHHFKAIEGGVEMTDEVHYAMPLGWLGRLANLFFVEREVNRIFDHRFSVLTEYFKK
jgi:ligand-binding SRPBCC domain-containing protein